MQQENKAVIMKEMTTNNAGKCHQQTCDKDESRTTQCLELLRSADEPIRAPVKYRGIAMNASLLHTVIEL